VWQGRIIEDQDGNIALAGSASSLKFRFQGDACRIRMANIAGQEEDTYYNYYSLIVDGKRYPRTAIKTGTLTAVEIPVPSTADYHDVELYKETETRNGLILISAIEAAGLGELPVTEKPKIEFIGDSYTAGMSSDVSVIPCDQGTWFDQHNAYDAFGPLVARELNGDYLIAAVSGMGMYRNWNTNHPVIGDVYESAVLSDHPQSPRWNYTAFIPDIVVLAFGANDLSDGDYGSPRSEFDADDFAAAYSAFLKKINFIHPHAKFLIVNNPGLPPEKDHILKQCLADIKQKTESETGLQDLVTLFHFKLFTPNGCGGHPDVTQHRQMADALRPVLERLLKK
jgi:hypothetical protein